MKSEYLVKSRETCPLPGQEPPQVAEEPWTVIIGPDHPWWQLDLEQLWRYRDLVRLFVRRDFVAYYKQTVLGPLWFFIQPLFSSLIFTLVFGRIAKISTEGTPDFLFYLSDPEFGYLSGERRPVRQGLFSPAGGAPGHCCV
jgi:hypothetical protein